MGSEDVHKLVERKRTIEILGYLSGGGVRNYSEIESAIDTSSVTVSESLDLLRNYELIEREEVSKKDVRYEITDTGEKFLEGIQELDRILSTND